MSKSIFKGMNVQTLITGMILFVVFAQVAVSVVPEILTALDNLSGISGLQFASLLASSSIGGILVSAALLLIVLGALGIGKGKR